MRSGLVEVSECMRLRYTPSATLASVVRPCHHLATVRPGAPVYRRCSALAQRGNQNLSCVRAKRSQDGR
eukprot:265535-Pleurochrysis_carterae.AAC.1